MDYARGTKFMDYIVLNSWIICHLRPKRENLFLTLMYVFVKKAW
jgi:hypothetical protein